MSLGCYIDPSIPSGILGDPLRLQQILFNLVGNALKFTETGEIWIEVRRCNPGQIRFQVNDSGPGIEVKFRGTLFERFTQVDASLTREHGGTGLGLSIARDLVHLMGGQIGYEERPGQGSSFWFSLAIPVEARSEIPDFGKRVWCPVDDVLSQRLLEAILPQWGCSLVSKREDAEICLEGGEWQSPIRQSRLREVLIGNTIQMPIVAKAEFSRLGLRILVAEDNLVNQRLVMTFLKRLGCSAQLVENGRLAVESARVSEFDVILMDYQMPVLDGLSAAREIRENEGPNRLVPIIVLTAGIMALDSDLLRSLGITDVLAKPYSLDALRVVLSGQATRQSIVTVD